MKLLNPISTRMTTTINATGMNVIAIHRCIFTIHLSGYDNSFTNKIIHIRMNAIIIVHS